MARNCRTTTSPCTELIPTLRPHQRHPPPLERLGQHHRNRTGTAHLAAEPPHDVAYRAVAVRPGQRLHLVEPAARARAAAVHLEEPAAVDGEGDPSTSARIFDGDRLCATGLRRQRVGATPGGGNPGLRISTNPLRSR